MLYLNPGHYVDSKRRPVSPGPESKYLGSLDNLAEASSHDCECDTHPKLTHQVRYKWASQESGIYDGTLKPAGQRRVPEMFRPSWRRPEADRPRSTSPHWRSFSEAALGVTGVNGTGHVPSPSNRPVSRTRNLSYESGREESLVKNSIGSQTNTHVDRLARSGSAASLAVVMASTFPNGGDANFDLEGTAQKINEVCKTFSNSQQDVSSSGVNITRSRSMNSALNVIHSPEAKMTARPLYFGPRSTAGVRIRATPEKRVCQPVRATRPAPSYKEIKELQEKLKTAKEISYSDLISCPRNRLPPHIDKLQLQDCLSDHEFVEVFKMRKEDFKRLAPWKRAHLKKEVLLF